ncbi:MAG: MFS transporter, partial [Oscillochloris sp.]|nr:MFS transporter [Oscillochloris sp.]
FNLALVALGYDRQTLHIPLIGELSMLGVLNSLPILAGALSSLPLWWLMNRVGLRIALLIATVLATTALLGIALAAEPLLLLVGITLGGPSAVLFQISAAPLMMRISDTQSRDTLFSLNVGISIGVSGVGSLIAGLLPGLTSYLLHLAPQSAGTYQATFAVAAVVVLLSTTPLLILRVPAKTSHDPPGDLRSADSLIQIIVTRPWSTLQFLISPLLISCGAALLIPYLSLYFRQRYAAPDVSLGLIFAAVGIAAGATTLIAPQISARLGKPRSIVLTQTLATLCLLLLGMAPTLWAAAAIALLRGALMNMATPLYQAHAMEQTPEAARPVVIGLIGAAYAVGYVLGPTISAEVQRYYGFTPLFAATTACYSLAAIVNYMLFVRSRRKHQNKQPTI